MYYPLFLNVCNAFTVHFLSIPEKYTKGTVFMKPVVELYKL